MSATPAPHPTGPLRHVTATRYVTPLREGGSLPGLMEADDLGTYVVKYRGAGQGPKVLVAEVVAGELARALGLPTPEIVTVDLDPALGASEPDQEVQELLRGSAGLNLGTDFLPGSLDLDPAAFRVEPGLAGRILWFDALIGNVDRSWRNSNMLFWHGGPYLIDHGASLTFHHAWSGADAWVGRPYAAADHVLLPVHPDLDAADEALAPQITAGLLADVVARVPQEWLAAGVDADADPAFADALAAAGLADEHADTARAAELRATRVAELRAAYVRQLLARRDARETWLPGIREAIAAAPALDAPRPAGTSNRPEWLTRWAARTGGRGGA